MGASQAVLADDQPLLDRADPHGRHLARQYQWDGEQGRIRPIVGQADGRLEQHVGLGSRTGAQVLDLHRQAEDVEGVGVAHHAVAGARAILARHAQAQVDRGIAANAARFGVEGGIDLGQDSQGV